MIPGRSEPFYFGREDEQLFGCLHVSTRGRSRESGIVVVPPMDQEYLRSHRALRLLAGRLSGAGYPTLRFDLYATGDSAGVCELGSVERWTHDVDAARAELAARTGGACGALVGLRLGALLSVRSALASGGVRGLVLWDPVQDGRAFLEGLRRAHVEMVRTLQSRPKSTWEKGAGEELLGFPFPDALLDEIQAIDLTDLPRAPAERILLITSDEDPAAHRALAEALRDLGSTVRLEHQPGPRVWEEEASKALIPGRTLQTIVQWVEEELP